MADATRDVVIKVSIQPGETNIQSFKDIAEQIQRELQAAGSVHVGGYGGGGYGGSGSGASISPGAEPRYQYTPPGGLPTAYTPPGPTSYQPGGYADAGLMNQSYRYVPGMPGYGQSVRDRGAAFGAEFTGAMRTASGGAGLSDEHWQRLEQRFSRQAEARIREQDREASNAEKAYDREANAAVAAYGRIMAERRKLSEQTTRALQQEIRLQERADEHLSRTAASDHYARRAEIYNSFGDINRGVHGMIGGSAALYSATGGPDTERMMQIMLGAHGVGSVYRGGAALIGGAAGLAGLGAGAAGAAGVAGGAVLAAGGADLAWSHLKMNESNNRMYRLYDTINRGRAAEFRSGANIGSLRGNLDFARAVGINPLAVGRDAYRTQLGMLEQREQSEYESSSFEGFGNRVQTLGQHEEEVTRFRQRLGFTQGQRGFEDRLKDLDERRGFLKSGQAKLEAEPARIRAQAEKQRAMLDTQINQIDSSPEAYNLWGKKVLSKKQEEKILSLSTQRSDTHATEEQAIVKNAEEVLRNKEKQAQVEQDILQTLAQQNKSIEQYKSEALEVAKVAGERTKQHRMDLGSSSIGDMYYRKELDEKHKRIEAQKAKNRAAGDDEFANVDEYTQEELAYLRGTNDIARKSAEAQALKQGKELGIGGYYDEDEKKAQQEYQERVDRTAGKTDQIAGSAQGAEKNAIETAKQANKSLETIEILNEVLQRVVEALEKVHARADEARGQLREFT